MTHVVDVDPRTYTITDDFASVYQALIAGAVFDEATGASFDGALTVTTDRTDVTARAVSGGFFVAAGYPYQLLLPASITLTFSAPGYDTVSTTVVLPASAVFPVDAGSIQLRHEPIRLQGRVLNATTRNPVGNALVTIVTPNLIALRTPVQFDHAAGVAVNQRPLTPSGPPTQLSAQANGGSGAIDVLNSAGLNAADTLRLGADPEAEYAVVASLGPAAGQINLVAPLERTLAAGSVVQLTSIGAVGLTQNLARAAKAGDGVLLLVGALAADTVEIADGATTEYGVTGALTDAQGFYRLNGIGGVAAVDLKASATGFSDSQSTYSLDYAQPVNVVNFRLMP